MTALTRPRRGCLHGNDRTTLGMADLRQEFGEAEDRFKALGAEKVQESEETYLLAAGSDANVKIRDQLLDIKLLESRE